MSRKDSNAQCDLWSGVSIRLLLRHAVLNTQPILTYTFKLSILTTPKIVSFTLPPRVGSRKEWTPLWGSRVGVEGIGWILSSIWATNETTPKGDQGLQITPFIKQYDKHPCSFHMRVPQPHPPWRDRNECSILGCGLVMGVGWVLFRELQLERYKILFTYHHSLTH